MAETYKILGQLAPSDTLEKVLYTSPANTQTLVTNITVTNRASIDQTFDINVYDTVKTSNDLVSTASPIFIATPNNFKSYLGYSTNGITWITTPAPATRNWSSVVYGNSTFVATAGNSSFAAYSSNGINWFNSSALARQDSWGAATFGNNTFITTITGSNTTTASSSTDGITWTTRTMPSAIFWYSTAFGNNTFVAVARSAAFGATTSSASSTDGITWTLRTMPASLHWIDVVYGARFIAVATNVTSAAATSTDGITWTSTTLPLSQNWQSVAYGNGRYVVITNGSSITAYSTDATTWTQGALPSSASWNKVTFGNGTFVAVSNTTSLAAYSTDGITWNASSLPTTGDTWVGVGYGNPILPYVSPKINNVYKGVTILANQSEILEPGITLGAQNSIVVDGTSNLTFSAYGVELS